MTTPLILFPAVDVIDGQSVRLVQGKSGSETGYGPALQAALAWQNQGAQWIHLVDLDAAFGRGSNHEILTEVIRHLHINVELSGGIRDDASLAKALETGCARVNLGTAALENPHWCAEVIRAYGSQIAIALDVGIIDGHPRLRGRGWQTDGGPLWPTVERLSEQGCSRFVVTDVSHDGTLQGPNLDLLTQVAHRTDVPIIASGGIASLDDLRAISDLVEIGVEGAIIGKALYAQRFSLSEALEVVQRV